MKIGILSDSHENMPALGAAVDIFNSRGVEKVFHAGDMISPITYKQFSALKCPMVCVFGNNDGDRAYLKEKFMGIAEFYEFYSGEIAGRKVFMSHQPDFLRETVSSGGYDIVIYGHTHAVDIRREKETMIINPGECGGWLTGRKTIVVLDTGNMEYDLLDI